MYYVVRPSDGLICSRPASYEIADGIARYLVAVTGRAYEIRRDGVRVTTVRPG